MRRIGCTLLVVIMLIVASRPAAAQAQIEITATEVSYTFGGQVSFRVDIACDFPIETVEVFFQSAGSAATYNGYAQSTSLGSFTLAYDLTRQQPLRPFSTVNYWFRITPLGQDTFISPEYSFFYEDNRFDWQSRSEANFTALWYDGDAAVGQMALDTAKAGLTQKIATLLPQSKPPPVRIYIYASSAEMQSALRLAGLTWVAGHADTDIGVIVVSLPAGPDQYAEAQRQIPHELMHIFLHQMVGARYPNLPTWLNEGLASLAELSPNPDYERILAAAVEKEQLMSIASLCQSFPTDSSVFLAYAEAAYFTRYLHGRFGAQGLQELILRYADGMDCEQGSLAALGVPLSQLQADWQDETFGRTSALTALGELLPWAVLMGLVLAAPLGLTLLPRTRRKNNPTTARAATKG